MIAVMGKLMDSWYDLIKNISVDVFKEGSVPEDADSSYVVLRAEGGSENDTKHSFVSNEVIIVDIVTMFEIAIDRSVCEGIDNEIKTLLKTIPATHNLPIQTGIQILSAIPETTNYLEEYDSGKKYYRKIVRYTHRIIQN